MTQRVLKLAALGTLLILSVGPALAADTAATAAPNSYAPVGMLQVVLGLVLVLGLILGTGWVMRRINPSARSGSVIKVISAASVGQRERVVLVEVSGSWLLLGVASGQVNLLQSLPKPPNSIEEVAPSSTFIDRLKEATKRHGRH
jgi:flagellar protein FliO/FliZ